MSRVLLILSVFCLYNVTFAKDNINWKYKSFPVLSKNSNFKKSEPSVLGFGKNKLSAIMSKQSGTHRIWGIDQVYLNPKSSGQRLFVKYNVDLGKKAPIDDWVKLNKGHIIHIQQKNKKFTAYFAQGFVGSQGKKDLRDLYKQFKKNQLAYLQHGNWLIPCAYAEVSDSDPAIGYDAFLNEPQRTGPGRGPLARAERVMTCVGGQAIDNAAERGRVLWESATWENVRNTAGVAWAAVPTLEETGSGIAAGATWVWDRVSDPVETWNRVSSGFDRTRQIFVQVYQEVATSMAGFSGLEPAAQDEIVCHIMAQMAADGALGVALGATGVGATVAVTRLMNSVRRLTTSLQVKIPQIREATALPEAERLNAIRGILRGVPSRSLVRNNLNSLQDRLQDIDIASSDSLRNLNEAEDQLRRANRMNNGNWRGRLGNDPNVLSAENAVVPLRREFREMMAEKRRIETEIDAYIRTVAPTNTQAQRDAYDYFEARKYANVIESVYSGEAGRRLINDYETRYIPGYQATIAASAPGSPAQINALSHLEFSRESLARIRHIQENGVTADPNYQRRVQEMNRALERLLSTAPN